MAVGINKPGVDPGIWCVVSINLTGPGNMAVGINKLGMDPGT